MKKEVQKPYLCVIDTSYSNKAISQLFLRSGWLLYRLAALFIQY